MPITSMPARRKETAAVEITALAAGAGPPANRIAARWKLWVGLLGGDKELVMVRILMKTGRNSARWSAV